MGKKAKQAKFDNDKAVAAGATWHETDAFVAVTIPGDGCEKIVRFSRNGRTWIHSDFRK